MLRLAAVFIAVCMVVIAGSLAAVCYLFFGLGGAESAVVGLTALTGLALYNTVSTRLRDRSDIGDQIADLSRLTADLGKQMAELKRNLGAAESKVDGAVMRVRAAVEPVTSEIGELGVLVKQLAETVAVHETRLAAQRLPEPPVAAIEPEPVASPMIVPVEPAGGAATGFKALDAGAMLAAIREAVDANRMDLYLQPVVTLPQRKVRFYEALTRLRLADGEQVLAEDFMPHAEAAGLLPRIDHLLVFRCVQILRRLLMKNREVGLFCNLSGLTLGDAEYFPQLSDFMDANKAIAPSLTFELRQDAYRAMGPLEFESMAALSMLGYRFSMDHVTDLRMEPRELSERGFRYLKVPGAMLLRENAAGVGDIHPADLSDLLARYHIDLIAERIESESAVVDLLDFDVRFGQGFLFSQPRPVRADAMQPGANGSNGGNGERASIEAEPLSRAEPRLPGINDPGATKLAGRLGVVA
jgi:cyclic-di-GMP phosphodiesterase TipF (flagellum assembly factor)